MMHFFRLFSLYLLVVFFSLLSVPVVYGSGFQYITAPEVKSMIEKDPSVMVINTLSSIEFDGLHIPDSINIPVINFRTSTLLPQDKTTPLIVYCMGHD